jgi:hypothetical protein
MVRVNPGATGQRGVLAIALQQIDERERKIALIGGQTLGHRSEQVRGGQPLCDLCTGLTQYPQPPLADKTIGVLDHYAKMSPDAPGDPDRFSP